MTSKKRKAMIENWVKEFNPKAILRAADARKPFEHCSMTRRDISFLKLSNHIIL